LEKITRTSFARVFIAVCILGIVFTAGLLSLIFFFNFRSLSSRQLEAATKEQIAHLQDLVSGSIQQHTDLLNHAAAGIGALLKDGYIPFEEMRGFLDRLAATDEAVDLLFFSSNYVWNQPGGYYINNGWRPAEDWDNTKRPWFINAKKNPGAVSYNDPYIDANSGKLGSTFSTVVFSETGEDLGVAAAGIWVTNLATLLAGNSISDQQHIYLLNNEGLFITHPDPSVIMTKNFFTEMNLERFRNNVLSPDVFSRIDDEVFIYASPVAKTSWFLVSVIPVSVIFAETNRILIRLAAASLLLVVIASAAAVLISYFMLTVPIRGVKRIAGSLADMDFTVEVKRFRNDEIGEMQRALIKIRDSLKKGIADLRQSHITKAVETAKRLNTVVVESFEAIEMIRVNMDSMDNKVHSQMQSVKSASDSSGEIFKHIDAFEQTVRIQAECVDQSSEAVERAVLSINAVRRVVEGTGKATETLSKSSESGGRLIQKLSEGLNRIEAQSAAMQSANKTIADIAGQTNILAMNAAIEAAHAGDSGKGFAVVAGEIRKLAEMSSKESEAVSQEIKKIEQVIRQIGAVSQETFDAMTIIFNEIKNMSAAFGAINRAVEEQSGLGGQMLSNLQTLKTMTEKVREQAGAIHHGSDAINREMENLTHISEEVTENVYTMRSASISIASFLQNAKELAQGA
jgi:methyl-accepting chemotaxis protein